MALFSTIVIETFKALYTTFVKKTAEELLWPKVKSVFSKFDKTTLEDCFNKALGKVMSKYKINDEELLKSKIETELHGDHNLLKTFPAVSDSILGDFYSFYSDEINKHTEIKKKIENNRQLLTDDAVILIDRNFENIVSDVCEIKKDVHDLVINKGLGADVKIVEAGQQIQKFNSHIIIREDVEKVSKLLSIGKIINLYGGRLVGKDILAEQVAQANSCKKNIHIDLHYKNDINVIEMLKKYDAANQIVIVSNLNYRFGDDYSERVISSILERDFHSIIIITTLEPIEDLLNGTSTKGVLLYEVRELSTSDMRKLALTYGMPSDFPLKKLVFSGYQHPLVANACCYLCQKDEWKGSKILADLLFQVQDFDLSRKMSILIKRFVADDATRNLMARINLLRINTLPLNLVGALANVAPSIDGYMEKINELMPDWLQLSGDSIKVNSLLRYWQYGLMNDEKKSCYIASAEFFLNKKTLDPIEIGWIITFFANAGEYDNAGYVYSSALEKLKPLRKNLKETPLFVFFWIDLPLPTMMSAPVKITVRLSQLKSPFTDDKYKDYLVKDLFEVLNGGAVSDSLKDLSYKFIGFYAASKGDMWLSQKCIEMDEALVFRPLKLPKKLMDEQDELNEKFRQIPLYLLFKSSNIEEFKTNLSHGPFDISMTLAYGFANCVFKKLISESEEPFDWNALLSDFRQYVSEVKKSQNTNFYTAFKTMQLLIEGKDLQNIELMEKDYQDTCLNVKDDISFAMFHYALGYSYYSFENYTKAEDCLKESSKYVDNLPPVISKKIYLLLSYIAAHNGNQDKQLQYFEEIDKVKDIESTDLERIELIGERAIANWDSGKIDESVRLIGKALLKSVELFRQDESNIFHKYLLAKVGCCVSQWYYRVLHDNYEEGKVYPIPGIFTEHYEDVWTEGNFEIKEFGVLLQMYHLESITINANTGMWAKELIKSSKLHPNNLHQILKILTIPMVLNKQYSDIFDLLDIDINSKSLPAKKDMPSTDPTGSFFNFFIIPLLMEYVIDSQEAQPEDLLSEVIMPIIKRAQRAEGYCDNDVLFRIMAVLNGNPVDKDEENIWVKVTEQPMLLAGNCSPSDAFLYLFNILEQVEPLYIRINDSERLMSDFAYSVLQKQIRMHPDEMDVIGINERGEKYINQNSKSKRYKRILNVFYYALKHFKIEANLENKILDWIDS